MRLLSTATAALLLPAALTLAQSPADTTTTADSSTPTALSPLESLSLLGYHPHHTILSPHLPSATPSSSSSPELELREVVAGAAVAQATSVTQVAPITTLEQWVTVNGAVQEVQVVYTQTFANIPDQWPSPSQGSIGLGTYKMTATKKKRDAEAEATGVAEVETMLVKKERRGVKENGAVGVEGLVKGKAAGSVMALVFAVVGAVVAF